MTPRATPRAGLSFWTGRRRGKQNSRLCKLSIRPSGFIAPLCLSATARRNVGPDAVAEHHADEKETLVQKSQMTPWWKPVFSGYPGNSLHRNKHRNHRNKRRSGHEKMISRHYGIHSSCDIDGATRCRGGGRSVRLVAGATAARAIEPRPASPLL
jgi:hypothetical protein